MDPLENPDKQVPEHKVHLIADITHPLHLKIDSWAEHTRQLEDYIEDSYPFDGKWQSYVEEQLLFIPEEYWPLFENGGVITVSTERHLLLFGSIHWRLFKRSIRGKVGTNPLDNRVVRHVLGNSIRFDKLGEGGTVRVPSNLLAYAGIEKEVAIIGVTYQAEVHALSSYQHSLEPDEQTALIEQFNKNNKAS